jgi:Homeodomain-like domain/Transposase
VRLPDEATMRRQRRDERWATIQALHQDGLSYSAIAARVGVHRVTVSTWLRHGPPRLGPPLAQPGAGARPDDPPGAASPTVAAVSPPPPPPAPTPWPSWEEVRRIRDALTAHRFLLVRRPERLTVEQQAQVAALVASPAGGDLAVARRFLEEWRQLWRDADGQRRSAAEAQRRYHAWRTRPEYYALAPLRRVLARMTAERFAQLGAFLRHPIWEATNNGAERGGRAFRHRQAPHFNLRGTAAIEGAIIVDACQRKGAVTDPAPPAGARCRRGRLPKQPHGWRAAA